MLHLIMAVVCSAAISLVIRFALSRGSGKFAMLSINYVVCLFLSFAFARFDVVSSVEGIGTTLWMGVINGVLYLLSFVLLQFNTRKNGVVLSSVFMKLGLLVPLILSVSVFGEVPSVVQIIAFVLAIAAILLISLQKGEAAGAKLLLLAQLLAAGAGDAMAKFYEHFGVSALSDRYLFYTFAVATVLCIAITVYKREKWRGKDILFGVLLGVPNFFAVRFLLGALGVIDAVVVYPTYSVATILVVTLFGVFCFKERLKVRQWIALVGITAAILLLNLQVG